MSFIFYFKRFSKVELRDKEIERLNRALQGGRPHDVISLEAQNVGNEKLIAHLNLQASIFTLMHIFSQRGLLGLEPSSPGRKAVCVVAGTYPPMCWLLAAALRYTDWVPAGDKQDTGREGRGPAAEEEGRLDRSGQSVFKEPGTVWGADTHRQPRQASRDGQGSRVGNCWHGTARD